MFIPVSAPNKNLFSVIFCAETFTEKVIIKIAMILCVVVVFIRLRLTVLQLGEGAENRSRNFQFSTDLSKTAWCCELTIFLAKTKRFLRQSKPKFSTYTELRSFAKLPVICSAFCSVGLEICRSSGGKFILFWRRAKDGREKLFCSLWFCGWCSGLQMCFFLCGWFVLLTF